MDGDEVRAATAVASADEVPALDAEAVGVLTEAVRFTKVLAPPEACTIPVAESVDDSSRVDEFADSPFGDDPDAVLEGTVFEGTVLDATAAEAFGEGPEGEASAVPAPAEEPLDDGLLGAASAMSGLLAMAKPSPNATASAPTRPICLALPIVAPCRMGDLRRRRTLRRPSIDTCRIADTPRIPR